MCSPSARRKAVLRLALVVVGPIQREGGKAEIALRVVLRLQDKISRVEVHRLKAVGAQLAPPQSAQFQGPLVVELVLLVVDRRVLRRLWLRLWIAVFFAM